MARINLVSIFSGRRGTGKTYFFLKIFLPIYTKVFPKKRVLIMDTLDHPMYRHIEKVKSSMLSKWRKTGGIHRIYGEEPDVMLENIEKYMRNALIVYEDASKYINANLQDSVRRSVLDSKQKNLDMIFFFHGFSYIPPKLLRIVDELIIFKSDNPEYRKKEIVAYEEVKDAWEEVMKDPNPYAHKTVRLQ